MSSPGHGRDYPPYFNSHNGLPLSCYPSYSYQPYTAPIQGVPSYQVPHQTEQPFHNPLITYPLNYHTAPPSQHPSYTTSQRPYTPSQQQQHAYTHSQQQQHSYAHARTAPQYRSRNLSAPQKLTSDFPHGSLNPVSKVSDYSDMKTSYRHGNITTGSPSLSAVSPLKVNVEDMFLKKATSHGISITPPQGSPKVPVTMETSSDSFNTKSGDSALKTLCSTASVQAALKHSADNASIVNPISMTTASFQKPVGSNWTKAGLAPGWKQSCTTSNKNSVTENSTSKPVKAISPSRSDLFFERAWKLGIICSKPQTANMDNANTNFKTDKFKTLNQINDIKSSFEVNNELIKNADLDPIVEKMEELYISVAKKITHDIMCSAIIEINAEYGMAVEVDDFLKGVEDLLKDADNRKYQVSETNEVYNRQYQVSDSNEEPVYDSEFTNLNLQNVVKASSISSSQTSLLNPDTPEFKPINIDVAESYLPFQRIPISPDNSDDNCNNNNAIYCDSQYYSCRNDDDKFVNICDDFEPQMIFDLVDKGVNTEDTGSRLIKQLDTETQTENIDNNILNQSVPLADLTPYSDELVDCETQTENSWADIGIKTQPLNEALANSAPKVKTRNRKLQTDNEILGQLPSDSPGYSYMKILEKEVYSLRGQMCLNEIQREIQELYNTKSRWTSFFTPKHGGSVGLDEMLNDRIVWLEHYFTKLQTQLEEGMKCLEKGVRLGELPEFSIYIPTASGNTMCLPKSVMKPSKFSFKDIKNCFTVSKHLNDNSNTQDSVTSNVSSVNLLTEESTQSQLNSKSKDFTESQINPKPNQSQMLNYGIGFKESMLIPATFNKDSNVPVPSKCIGLSDENVNTLNSEITSIPAQDKSSMDSNISAQDTLKITNTDSDSDRTETDSMESSSCVIKQNTSAGHSTSESEPSFDKSAKLVSVTSKEYSANLDSDTDIPGPNIITFSDLINRCRSKNNSTSNVEKCSNITPSSTSNVEKCLNFTPSSSSIVETNNSASGQSFSDHATEPFNNSANLLASSVLSTGKAPDLVKQSNSCIITEQNSSADHLVSSVRKTSDRDISDHATEQDNSANHLPSRTEKTPNRVNQSNSCIVTEQNNSANHLASSASSITKTSDMVNKSCPDDAKEQNDSVNHSNSNILKCSNTSNATVTDIASVTLITDSNLTNVTTCLTTSVAIPKSVAVPLNKSNIKELLQELKTTNVKNNPPKSDSDNPLLFFIEDANQNNSQSKSLVPSSALKSNSSKVFNSQFDSFDAFSRERFLESQQKMSTPNKNCLPSSKDPVSSIQSRANGDNSLTLPTGCNLIESPNGVQKCQTTKLTSPAEHKLGTIEEVSEFIVDDHGEDACCLSTSLLKKLTTIPEETETSVLGSDKNAQCLNTDETAKENNAEQIRDLRNFLMENKMSRSVDDGCKNNISEDTTINLNVNNSNSGYHNNDLKTETDLGIKSKENNSDDATASLNNPVENFPTKDLSPLVSPKHRPIQLNYRIDIDELTEKVDTYLSEEQKKQIMYCQEKCKGIDIDELAEKVDTYLSEERKTQIFYCQEKCKENSTALNKLCKSLDGLESQTDQSIENTDKEDGSGMKKITPVNDKSAIKKPQKNSSSSQIVDRDHSKQDLLGKSLQSDDIGANAAVAVKSEPKEINKNDAGQQNLVDPKLIKDDTEDAEGNQSESCRDQKVSCIETKIKTAAVENQSNSVTEPAVSVNPQIPRSSVEKSSAVNKDLLIPSSSKERSSAVNQDLQIPSSLIERSSAVNQDLLKAVMTQLVADYPNLLLNPEHLEKLAIHQTQLLQSYIPGGDNNSQDAAPTGNTVSTSKNPENKINAQCSSVPLVQQHSQFQNSSPNQTVMMPPNNYSCPKTNKGSFEGSDNISTGASSSGKSSPVFMNNPVSKQETQPSENSEQFKLPSTHQFVPPGITMQPARCQFVPVPNVGPRFLATNNSVNQPPMVFSGPSPQMFMPFSPFPPQPNVQMLQPYPMQLSNPVLLQHLNMCGLPPQTQSSLKGAQPVTNPLQSRNTQQNGIRFNAHQPLQQVPVATSVQGHSESASQNIDRLTEHSSPNVDRLSEHYLDLEESRKEPSPPESIKSYLVERKKARSVKRRNLFTSSDVSCDEDGMDSDAGGGFSLNKSVDSSFFKSCGPLGSPVSSGRLIPDPAVPSTATTGSAQSGGQDVPCGTRLLASGKFLAPYPNASDQSGVRDAPSGTRLDAHSRLAAPHPNTSGQFGGRDVSSGTRLDAPGRLTAPHPNTSGQSAASRPTGSAQPGVEYTRSSSCEQCVPIAVSLKSTAQNVLSAANATCGSLRSSISANTNTMAGPTRTQFPSAGCLNSKTQSQIPSPLNLDNLSGKKTQSQIPPLQNFPSLKQDLVSNTSNITESTKPRKRNKTAPEAAPVPQKAPQKVSQKASNDDWDTEVDPYPTTFTFVSAPKRPLNFGDHVSDLCSFGAAVVPPAPNSIPATNQTLSTKKKTAEKLSNSKSDPSRVNTQFLGRLLKSAESSNERKKLKSNSAETSRFVDAVVGVTSPVSTDTENLSDDWVTVPTNKKPKKAKVEVPTPKVTKATSKKSQGSKAAKGEGAAFDRLIELMSQRIPNVTRQDVLYIISHIRQKKGSLKGIPLNDIIDTGKQLMANKQKPCPVPRDTQFAKDLPPRFKRLVEKSSLEMPVTLACDEGDICVICCDELDVEKTKSLDCGHTFHIMCINEWVYKHERTCPTCRKIALFPDEFPELGK